jgi:hypothetical protein
MLGPEPAGGPPVLGTAAALAVDEGFAVAVAAVDACGVGLLVGLACSSAWLESAVVICAAEAPLLNRVAKPTAPARTMVARITSRKFDLVKMVLNPSLWYEMRAAASKSGSNNFVSNSPVPTTDWHHR